MRSKEESADYRYFPDPDLPPLVVEESWIEKVRSNMPKLPEELRVFLMEELDLSSYDASVLTAERDDVEYFMECLGVCKNAKAACNWISSELFGLLKKDGLSTAESPISAQHLGELIRLIDQGSISGKMAKDVFEEAFKTGGAPSEIIRSRGLEQISDEATLMDVINTILDENEEQLVAFLEGKDKLRGFFIGQAMKATKGTANPQKLNELLDAALEKRKG